MSSNDNIYKNSAIPATGILTLSVRNWEKHNPRHDRPNLQWFKMATDFFTDPEVYNLSLHASYLLVYCLTQQGRSASKPFKLNIKGSAVTLKLKPIEFTRALKELQSFGFINLIIETQGSCNQRLPDNLDQETNGRSEKSEEKEGIEPAGAGSQPKVLSLGNEDALEEFIQKSGQAYGDIAWVRREVDKAKVWIMTKPGRQFTIKFITNWLARSIDNKPIPPKNPDPNKPLTERVWDAEKQAYVEVNIDHQR